MRARTPKEKLYGNCLCLKMVKEIVDNGYDPYSYVASKIFNCDIRECREFSESGVKLETGKHKRDVAKKLCLGATMFDEVAERFNEPNLKMMVVDAFPFTFFDEIYEEPDESLTQDEILNDRVIAAHSFLTEIRGYARVVCMQKDMLKYGSDMLAVEIA